MRIGIDIDGVLTNMLREMVDYGTKFCYEHGVNYSINLNGYYEDEILGISDDEVRKFWKEYLLQYMEKCPIRNFASEVISKLNENNDIYIITARNNEGLGENDDVQNITKKWLSENNVKYKEIIFSGENKLEVCKQNKIDVMIEDSPKNIMELSKEIKVMCFNNQYNSDVEGKNIVRVYSWYDVFRKINKM